MNKRTSEEIAQENELVVAFKASGDLEVLGKLFQPYMHLVYGVCLKYLKDREDSQDAVMQIFEKLVDAVKKHEIENFKSWLYVLSKNHCLMQMRTKKYQTEKKSKDFSEFGMENEMLLHHNDESIDEENISKLESCIEQLQKEQQACVKLFYIEKKSYNQVVEKTNYELKKVKSHIQNGKRNLKICMEQESE